MNKSTMSVLFAAMMAVSGFAAAQAPAVKSGTQGGAGPTGASGLGDNGASVKTRAEVKAEAMPMKSGTQGGSGTSMGSNPNSTGAASSTSAERKAARAERRAAAAAKKDMKKANRADGMAAGPSTTTSGSPAANPGAMGQTLGQGQTSTPQKEGKPN